MSLQHVKAQQHVHGLVLKDGKGTRKEVSFDLDLSCRIKMSFVKFEKIVLGSFPQSSDKH